MFESKRTFAAVGRVAAILLGAIIFAAVLPGGGFAATREATKPSTSQEATPKQIQELMTLLADPKVRNWLEEQSKAEAASERAAAEEPVSQVLDSRLAAIREHIVALARAVPDLPNQYWQGHHRVTADLGENGRVKALLLLAVFVGLGIGVEWLFRKATQRVRAHLDALPSETVKQPTAYRRPAFCVCSRSRRRIRARQHRSLPCTRLAAAAARGVIGPACRFSCLADRKCSRPFPAGAASRAVPRHSNRYGGCSFLASSACLVRGLVCLRLGDRRVRSPSWLHAGSAAAGRLRARARARRNCAGRGLASAYRASRRRRSDVAGDASFRARHG